MEAVESNVNVKYYSLKLLLTVDLNALVQELRKEFGDRLRLTFEEMSDEERRSCCEEVSGIDQVKKRVMVFVGSQHHADIESRVRST